MPKCTTCGAVIKFIKTPLGKFMPVEPGPKRLYKGDSKKMVLMSGQVISCNLFGPEEDFLGCGFVPHWPNCPGANQHRKTKEIIIRENTLFAEDNEND